MDRVDEDCGEDGRGSQRKIGLYKMIGGNGGDEKRVWQR